MSGSMTAPLQAYTDAPKLHGNIILGSLQLLGWLFFHPSAWRYHLARIDTTLRPNFGLTELKREQWRNPELSKLLLMSYFILPTLAALLVGAALWLFGMPEQIIFIGAAIGIIFSVGMGITSNLVVGTPVGAILGPTTGIACGLGIGLWSAFKIRGGRATGTVTDVIIETLIFAAAFGIVFGLSRSLVGVGKNAAHWAQRHSLAKQISGVTLSIVLSGIIIFPIGFNLAGNTANIFIISILAGLIVGLIVSWGRDPLAGIIIAMTVATGIYLASVVPGQSALGPSLFSAAIIPVYILTERIAGPLPAAIGSALGGGGGWIASTILVNHLPFWLLFPLSLLGLLFGLTIFWWRPLLMYPLVTTWNLLLRYVDERSQGNAQLSFFRWHSAFWDEYQRLPLLGLDEHLLLILERNPIEGEAALEYLTTSRQRWAAQTAQIELEARWLESCAEVEVIASVHRSLSAGELSGPASALLRSFSRLSQDVMAALQQSSAYNQRLALSAIEDRLDSLLRELTRSSERYAVRFRPIATNWRKIIADHAHKLAVAVELRQEIDNPYVIGIPLTEQQEIFVGRTGISARIEQLLLDRRRPPLLLYGQRRMGKTSLLNNLGRLLPSTIVPLFIDLQGPASQAKEPAGFFYNIARGMVNTAKQQRDLNFPRLTREQLTVEPFTYFDEWLDEVETALGQHTALVTLDEFEALDYAIAKGNLDGRALLNMLRHLIQHRPRFKILLTSSQTLDAFKRWSSYLINIQVVPISYLNETEAYQLIERPTKNFELRYEPEASRRVFALTRGHPFLTQLLCGEIVTYKNEQVPDRRRLANLADVEAVIPEALQRGSFFFTDIERNQVDPAGLMLLRFLAAQGEGVVVDQATLARQLAIPDLERTLALIERRELIEGIDGGYRFQVELIRRWFAQM